APIPAMLTQPRMIAPRASGSPVGGERPSAIRRRSTKPMNSAATPGSSVHVPSIPIASPTFASADDDPADDRTKHSVHSPSPPSHEAHPNRPQRSQVKVDATSG